MWTVYIESLIDTTTVAVHTFELSIMVRLDEFPPELLAVIALQVHPADVVNYALACKYCHSTAPKALARHRRLQKEYGNIGNHTQGTKEVYLPDVLKSIFHTPEIAFYIRRVSLR